MVVLTRGCWHKPHVALHATQSKVGPRLNKAQAATQSVLLTVPLAGSPCTGGHCLMMKKVLIFA